MDAKSYLKDYAGRADKRLERFFDRKEKEISRVSRGKGVRYALDMIERYRKFSQGGKKLRGALIQLGYEIAGGDKRDVLDASLSIEIIHSFLLMHDDIMDMDSIRRGAPTMHKQFEAEHKKLKSKKDAGHYGIAMGIDMGDLGAYMGMETLLSADLPQSCKIPAAIYLSRLLQRVAYGQALDVAYEQKEHVTETEVLEVHLQKTSVYTIGGPLKIGGLLGGMTSSQVDLFEEFGEPVGVAFQLRDDELGLFSDERKLGKPVGSDIREGKNTLLRIEAIKRAKGDDKKFLKYAYGNKTLSLKEVERVKNITINTGALEHSRELSRSLVEKGKKIISQITKNSAHAHMLSEAAEFTIARES